MVRPRKFDVDGLCLRHLQMRLLLGSDQRKTGSSGPVRFQHPCGIPCAQSCHGPLGASPPVIRDRINFAVGLAGAVASDLHDVILTGPGGSAVSTHHGCAPMIVL